MDVVIGFDPGGAGQFGWAVLEHSPGRVPVAREGDTAPHAADAVRRALGLVCSDDHLVAAGIDSPTYWTATGKRVADGVVRDAVAAQGAQNVAGTVQHPNALRGACVVQGPTAALLLRNARPGVRITEAHPKALLWMLGVAGPEHPVREIVSHDLAGIVDYDHPSDHVRDAVLGGVTALAMVSPADGWRDLVECEDEPIFIAGHVEYWFPERKLGR